MSDYTCAGCGRLECPGTCSAGNIRPARVVVPDPVNHPPHYQKPWGEVIDITETLNFNLGNVIKYVLRYEDKGGLEDLKKAQWYLNREIARLS